jgi:hypothetical protein
VNKIQQSANPRRERWFPGFFDVASSMKPSLARTGKWLPIDKNPDTKKPGRKHRFCCFACFASNPAHFLLGWMREEDRRKASNE